MVVKVTSVRVGGKVLYTRSDVLERGALAGGPISGDGWESVKEATVKAIEDEAHKKLKPGKYFSKFMKGTSVKVSGNGKKLIISVKGFDAVKQEIGWSPVPPSLESGLGVEPTGEMDMRPLLMTRFRSNKEGERYAFIPIEVDGGYKQVFGEMKHGLRELVAEGVINKKEAKRRLDIGRELIELHKKAQYFALERKENQQAYAWKRTKTLEIKETPSGREIYEEIFKVGKNAVTQSTYSTWVYSRLAKRRVMRENGKWRSFLHTIRTVTDDDNGLWITKGVEPKNIVTSDDVFEAAVNAIVEAVVAR
jgi:hypothetical protein